MEYHSGYPNLASTEIVTGASSYMGQEHQPKVCLEYAHYLYIYIIYYFKLELLMKNPKIMYLIN